MLDVSTQPVDHNVDFKSEGNGPSIGIICSCAAVWQRDASDQQEAATKDETVSSLMIVSLPRLIPATDNKRT